MSAKYEFETGDISTTFKVKIGGQELTFKVLETGVSRDALELSMNFNGQSGNIVFGRNLFHATLKPDGFDYRPNPNAKRGWMEL